MSDYRIVQNRPGELNLKSNGFKLVQKPSALFSGNGRPGVPNLTVIVNDI